MDNVEELCDHLCLLKRGVSLFSGSLLDLKKQYGKTKLAVRTDWSTTQLLALEGVKDVRVEKEQTVLTLVDESFAQGIFGDYPMGSILKNSA